MKHKYILILLILPALACALPVLRNEIKRAKQSSAMEIRPRIIMPSPTMAACHVKTGVEAGHLNMRAGSGKSFALVAILHEGELIALLDQPAGSAWLHVKARSLQGWVNPNFIECER